MKTKTLVMEFKNLIMNHESQPVKSDLGIQIKICKLTQIEISQHLADKFNLSFKIGIFPDSLKIAKVIPIHKKDLKVIVDYYHPISFLSNLDKNLEKLMHRRLTKFLDEQKNFVLKTFRFKKKILHPMQL